MVGAILETEINNVRIPIRRLRFDLAQNLERPVVLCVGFRPIVLTLGSITVQNEEVGFEESLARIAEAGA